MYSNLYNVPDTSLPNKAATIDTLIKRGVQFAVCQMATQGLAEPLAAAVGGNADNVFKELRANLVTNPPACASGHRGRESCAGARVYVCECLKAGIIMTWPEDSRSSHI
jgi:hypothetical protein